MLSTKNRLCLSLLESGGIIFCSRVNNGRSASLRSILGCRYLCSYETGEFPVKEWFMRKIEERLTHEWFVTQHDPLGSFYYATWLHKTKDLAELLKEREEGVRLSYHKLVDEGFLVDEKHLKRLNK
ncbi:hypothetical protein GpartN1_g6760.t1 [Galdieria partita]|uniref:Uncharacterized protein n=1 Tax=Galdieria partita TaxID=83374 RepID=A0A9C7Q269_9RHOD|nr:hypothetical protein GpartN1_g6760.t1 [Galdieria partita]